MSLTPVYIASLLVTVSVSAAPLRLRSGQAELQIDERSHTRLLYKGAELAPFAASETVTVDGTRLDDFQRTRQRRRSVRNGMGAGNETVITGTSSGIEKQVTITTYDAFPEVFVFQVRYTNRATAPVRLDGWANHRYLLPSRAGEPAFWSFQSGSYSKRPAWFLPLKAGFRQDNFQGMNQADYGGGTPVADVWRRDAGLGIGHLDRKPKLVSLPVAMPDDKGAELHIEAKAGRTLAPGESFETLKTFVSAHSGDAFPTLQTYRRLMVAQGVRLPASPQAAFEPIWCAWGYRRDFQPAQIYGAMPVVKKLGFEWVTLDDGWQTAEGDWYVDRKKFPRGDVDMKAMVDRIHRDGFRAQLWWAPMSVDPGTDLIREHADWLLLDEKGQPAKITYWNAFYLCPALPAVRKNAADLVTKFIKEWGWDGLKLDGQYMNAAPPCYNPAHKHADPNESGEAVPEFFQSIFEAALAAKPDAVVEFCPCGTSYSFFTLPYQNMAVASDPLDSWQIRTKGKALKALMGDQIAYFGDHVELSDGREDFASSVGIGAVIGTEFTWPVGTGPLDRSGQRRNDLTPEREQAWAKWVNVYKEKMLPKGEYLGGLYDIGFDRPETHAIRKDGKLYYGFYGSYRGNVELRGLRKGRYRVRDYVNGQDLGVVTGPVGSLGVRFEKSLLLEASPE